MPAGNMRFASMLADGTTIATYSIIIEYQADVILLDFSVVFGIIFHSAAVRAEHYKIQHSSKPITLPVMLPDTP